MDRFYRLGIDTLHTAHPRIRDGTPNTILSRHDGRSNYVTYGFFRTYTPVPFVSFPLGKKKYPNEYLAAKIFKLPMKYFTRHKIKYENKAKI